VVFLSSGNLVAGEKIAANGPPQVGPHPVFGQKFYTCKKSQPGMPTGARLVLRMRKRGFKGNVLT
jgi:hypothetical protein